MSDISSYLASIGAKGGRANSPAQHKARAKNAKAAGRKNLSKINSWKRYSPAGVASPRFNNPLRCLYVLWQGEIPVFIAQTTALRNSIGLDSCTMEFDAFSFAAVPSEATGARFEEILVKLHTPRCNHRTWLTQAP